MEFSQMMELLQIKNKAKIVLRNAGNFYTATSIFTLEVNEKCILKVKAYNKLADECYQKLVKGNIVGIQGWINSNMEIIAKDIEI